MSNLHRLTTLLLVSLALAGCAQGPSQVGQAVPQGSLEGWVLDASFRPVEGARITVGGVGSVASDAGGHYRLGALWPDAQQIVVVEADGFQTASGVIQPTNPAHRLRLNFTLAALPVGAWTDTQVFSGFIACGLIVQVGHSHGGGPEDDNHMSCPVDLGQGEQIIRYIPERNPDDMVIEVFWKANSELARFITVILYDDQGEIVQFEEGDSPLRIEVGRAHVKQLFQDGREATIELRPGIPEDDPPGELYYAVHVDQAFDVFASTSHGAPMPIGWSVAS